MAAECGRPGCGLPVVSSEDGRTRFHLVDGLVVRVIDRGGLHAAQPPAAEPRGRQVL